LELNPHPEIAIAETNINTYPTKDSAALKAEDRRVVERGYDNFFALMQLLRPAWIILLGKPAFDEGSAYFSTRFGIPEFRARWKDINFREPQLMPLANLRLSGAKCKVVGSRHFDKRPIKGLPDSDYSDERFLKFCREAWAAIAPTT
jgi:hypothetical protein